MDERTKELIAIAASVGANCKPCLRYYLEIAKDSGIDEQEILEAVEIAKSVRIMIIQGLAKDHTLN